MAGTGKKSPGDISFRELQELFGDSISVSKPSFSVKGSGGINKGNPESLSEVLLNAHLTMSLPMDETFVATLGEGITPKEYSSILSGRATVGPQLEKVLVEKLGMQERDAHWLHYWAAIDKRKDKKIVDVIAPARQPRVAKRSADTAYDAYATELQSRRTTFFETIGMDAETLMERLVELSPYIDDVTVRMSEMEGRLPYREIETLRHALWDNREELGLPGDLSESAFEQAFSGYWRFVRKSNVPDHFLTTIDVGEKLGVVNPELLRPVLQEWTNGLSLTERDRLLRIAWHDRWHTESYYYSPDVVEMIRPEFTPPEGCHSLSDIAKEAGMGRLRVKALVTIWKNEQGDSLPADYIVERAGGNWLYLSSTGKEAFFKAMPQLQESLHKILHEKFANKRSPNQLADMIGCTSVSVMRAMETWIAGLSTLEKDMYFSPQQPAHARYRLPWLSDVGAAKFIETHPTLAPVHKGWTPVAELREHLHCGVDRLLAAIQEMLATIPPKQHSEYVQRKTGGRSKDGRVYLSPKTIEILRKTRPDLQRDMSHLQSLQARPEGWLDGEDVSNRFYGKADNHRVLMRTLRETMIADAIAAERDPKEVDAWIKPFYAKGHMEGIAMSPELAKRIVDGEFNGFSLTPRETLPPLKPDDWLSAVPLKHKYAHKQETIRDRMADFRTFLIERFGEEYAEKLVGFRRLKNGGGNPKGYSLFVSPNAIELMEGIGLLRPHAPSLKPEKAVTNALLCAQHIRGISGQAVVEAVGDETMKLDDYFAYATGAKIPDPVLKQKLFDVLGIDEQEKAAEKASTKYGSRRGRATGKSRFE